MEKENGSQALNLPINRKITLKEFLIDEYNKHLSHYSRHLIEVTFTSGRPPDEIVLTIIQPTQSQPGMPNIGGIERKIRAKEAQMRGREQLSREESILKVVAKLIIEEEKKETKF